MSSNIMFFGSGDSELTELAKKYNDQSFLLEKSNYTTVIDNKDKHLVFYTSIEDLIDVDVFYQVVQSCSKIFYYPPSTAKKNNTYIHKIDFGKDTLSVIEYILFKVSKEIDVVGLENLHYNENSIRNLVDTRKVSGTQLWIAGCSHSHGVGVEKNLRYGQLLADKLKMSVSFLTESASSISWASDQILRSDINKNDIVVWGLTSPYRLTFWEDQTFHINLHSPINKDLSSIPYIKNIEKMLVSDHMYYDAITHIDQVINHCRKIDAKLLILGIRESPELVFHYRNTKEFFQFNKKNHWWFDDFVDFGTDGRHPGPNQHQLFADFCYKKMCKLGYTS
jgi:hypothetical protein